MGRHWACELADSGVSRTQFTDSVFRGDSSHALLGAIPWSMCLPRSIPAYINGSLSRLLSSACARLVGSGAGATSNVDDLSGDEGRFVTGKERRHCGNILRLTYASHRDFLYCLGLEFFE